MEGLGDTAQRLIEEARRYFTQWKLEESAEAFRRLAEMPGHEAEGHYGQGAVCFKRNDLVQAKTEFLQTLKHDPSHSNSYIYLAQIAERDHRPDQAIGYYSKALEFNPQAAAAIQGLAQLRIAMPEKFAPRKIDPLPARVAGAAAAMAPAHGAAGPPSAPLMQDARGSREAGDISPDTALLARVVARRPSGFYGQIVEEANSHGPNAGVARRIVLQMESLACEVRPPLSAFFGRIFWQAARVLILTFVILVALALIAKLASSFASVTNSQQSAFTKSQASMLNSQLAQVQAQIAALQGELTSSQGAAQRSALNEQIASLQLQERSLTSQGNSLQAPQPSGSTSSLFGVLNPNTAPFFERWAFMLGLAGCFLVLLFGIWRAKTTSYLVRECRIEVSSGVLSRSISNLELLKVEQLEVSQDPINRLTGDGALRLRIEAHNKAQWVNLRGLAPLHELRDMLPGYRNLVGLLRSGPWGKGVIY